MASISASRPRNVVSRVGRLFGVASREPIAGKSFSSPPMTSCQRCSGCSRSLSRCSPEVAQLDAVGQGVLHERAGRVRQQHLPAVSDARDAAGPVDVEADVGLRRQAGLAGVEADADAHLLVFRPCLGRQRPLSVGRRRDRGRCRREGGEERVALGADLVAAARLEGGSQQLAMAFEDGGPSLSAGAKQARRPLDVAEEERDGAGEQLGHRWGVCGVRGRGRKVSSQPRLGFER